MEPALKAFFGQYGHLPQPGMEELLGRFQVKAVRKGELLLAQGQVCNKLFFVKKGCLRLYYIARDIETTVWFSFEHNSAIELSSFLSGAPSDYFLEAVEESEVLFLHKSELEQICDRHPEMGKIMRVFWEDVILNLLRRFTALQKDSAEKRYLDLMDQPVYLQRIPQKYLASYIGVTPTSLSRIRGKIR
ncbi:MAG TPA: Crp/Fnr family transcriptional regulator [Flavilitoribacter sp.]|nr:Crp/Fnr family transcriptional regulator [Flavilitoribacter sp.]HMQ88975.1 Crp/Fnr family transcriptional regulator [Flavilitoribacter sp.]